MRGLACARRGGDHDPRNDRVPAATAGGRAHSPNGDDTMQWTTPTATDFRFGFEITMYVAAR